MAFGNLEDALKKWKEEQEKLLPGSTPEAPLPPEVRQEFASRFPTTNYDVNISDTTATMNGRPESLPQLSPSTAEPQKQLYEGVEEDEAKAPELAPEPIKSEPDAKASKPTEKETKLEEVFKPSDNDKAAREAGMAELERKRKLGIIPQLAAGFGDAMAMGVSAKGGNIAGGSMQRMIERQDKEYEQGKKDIEQKLRNDPNSDISKQYQDLVARFMQKDPKDPMLLGLTANQIAEKIPQIEKLVALRQQDELKRLQMEDQKETKLARLDAQQAKLDEKAALASEKKQGVIEEAKAQAGTIVGTIDDILNRDLVGLDTAGPTGSKWLAPLDYPDLAAKLDTIAGNIAFMTMNKLRQNSPTGGALGNVSDKDMALLMSVKGSLKQQQSPAQLKQTLDRLKQIYSKVQGYDADITPPWTDTTQPKTKKSTTGTTKSGRSFTIGQ